MITQVQVPTQPFASTVSGSIIVGVVSGAITSGLLFAAGSWLRAVGIPWYRKHVYQGIQVSGEWNFDSDLMQDGRLELTQSAGLLTGTLTLIRQEGEPHKERFEMMRVFHLKGTIQDRLIELSFRHRDASRIGAGSMLLMVVGDGRYLKGMMCNYSVTNDRIASATIDAYRPGAMSPKQIEMSVLKEAAEIERRNQEKRARKVAVVKSEKPGTQLPSQSSGPEVRTPEIEKGDSPQTD